MMFRVSLFALGALLGALLLVTAMASVSAGVPDRALSHNDPAMAEPLGHDADL